MNFLKIKVLPNSGERKAFFRNGVLTIKVCSKALDGKANAEVLDFLEEKTGCRPVISRGVKSRVKTIAFGKDDKEFAQLILR
ncbi:DUF167 domain-containing protein [Candidatus Micrarchaeota archaeon]|nr:DUF167 domain-containing protein [Candidatus Micrarchaeota archaeon]